MALKRLYEYDAEQAKINKEIRRERRGPIWKQIDTLDKLDRELESEYGVFGPILSQYEKIAEAAGTDEIYQRAIRGIAFGRWKSSEIIKSRLHKKVCYKDPEDFSVLDLLIVNLPVMGDRAFAKLRDAIERIGILVPILVTNSMDIIDGTMRVEAAKELEIPVPYIELNLDGVPEPAKTRIIIDIRISLNINRRYLKCKQKNSLLRQWLMLSRQKAQTGKPTKDERALLDAIRGVELYEIDPAKRKIINAFNLSGESQ